MAQTNLLSDDFCGINQESAPFFYIFQPHQYQDTFAIGEVGISALGGSAGTYVRPEVIDISSFLSGRDNILSKCVPPVPSLESLNNSQQIRNQNSMSVTEDGTNSVKKVDPTILIPKYTKELRSSNMLDTIDFNRWQPNLPVEAQNLNYIIEDFVAQRGGVDTRNFIKSSWSNQNNVENFDKNMCKLNLDPAMACGPFCEQANGYPGRNPITGQKKNVVAESFGKPPGQPDYPFIDITSQQLESVGAMACGPQNFYGPNLEKGYCPRVGNLDNVLRSN
jgi:hypothetical protein